MKTATLACLALIFYAILTDGIVLAKKDAPQPARFTVPQSQSGLPNEEPSNKDLPKVIFLNQRAVLVGSRVYAKTYKEHQAKLIDLMSKGVTVLICPDCMKQYGITAVDLIDGVQIGKPGQTHES